MNLRLVSRLLGIVSLLIGAFMVFSLPWAHPDFGARNAAAIPEMGFESAGFKALMASMLVCLLVGSILLSIGRGEPLKLYRKEAMAVVGLSWVMATILGAFPYYFSGCSRGPAFRLDEATLQATVHSSSQFYARPWAITAQLSREEFSALQLVLDAGYRGIPRDDLHVENPEALFTLQALLARHPVWQNALQMNGDLEDQPDAKLVRARYVKMTFIDTLFESQSGFSTTGATVISELEDPLVIPHCILFWRSSTHFLGGLGIIVLFVAILGQGSAGKALMRAELPGPTSDSSQPRIQKAAWLFAAIYCGLNVLLTLMLKLFGLTWFDALCHAFGTMATGGFSTYNASLGHFDNAGLEYLVMIFMILAGTNFALIYLGMTGKLHEVVRDVELQTYLGIIVVAGAVVVWRGLASGHFDDLLLAVRHGLFQVVSILTTTGYGTADFDAWDNLSRGLLFLLMFVGGCAGSTGGGMKVIRHVLFAKILRLELEQSFHPTVVRPLRVSGEPVEDPALRRNILVYFALILIIFCGSWLFVLAIESDTTWGVSADAKLIDTASAVAATLNNIGPGLGTVGATQNYGHFGPISKLLFTWLMMLGRVEVFVILCLLAPEFWRST